MRFVSRIKKILVIVLSAAIATIAMALPVCASTPLPSTPNPNIYPTHIDASLRVYYLKYSVGSLNFTASSYLDSSGNVYSRSGYGVTPYIQFNPSTTGMITFLNAVTNRFVRMSYICFYDSNQTFISSSNAYQKVNTFPDNAVYFRFAFSSSYTSSQMTTYYRVLVSPDDVAVSSVDGVITFASVFWQDYLSVVPYMINSNGHSVFIMSSSYPVDGLYVEISLSQSFHIANYISATVYTTVKDGSYNNAYYPVEYNDRDERDALPQFLTMRPFYIDSSGDKIYPDSFDVGAVLSDNPATVFVYSPDGLISGFNLFIPLNSPTGLTANSTIQVDISNIAFDDMSVVIPEWSISTVNQIENAVTSAEVPVPSFDLADIVVNAISNVDFNAANNVFGWFWGVSIVASMTALVGMFCLIGYVFFGKKG